MTERKLPIKSFEWMRQLLMEGASLAVLLRLNGLMEEVLLRVQ